MNVSSPAKRERLFGTDGIRGRFGEGWVAPGPVEILGRAIGDLLAEGELSPTSDGERYAGRVLLGHDGRRSGPQLEGALARGLQGCGHGVRSVGLITTPGLAHLATAGDFDLAAMISASHNPSSDNGIKLFSGKGEKLSDELELAIEEKVWNQVGPLQPEEIPVPRAAELLTPETNLEEAYLEHLLGLAGNLKLDGLAIALDCANGGGSRIAPRILGRLGAQVLSIACSPDGENINQGCGSTQPENLQEAVRVHGADLGIALDGDGDRCILVDEGGAVVHGDGILTLIAMHERERLRSGKIVATVMSNRGLHRALRSVGVGIVTVGVGDRQVVDALRSEGLSLGGEQSGHIVFGADNNFVGDGIYTALRVLSVLQQTQARLSELASPFQPFPQVLLNVQVDRKPPLDELPEVMEAVRSVEQELGDDGRVLLRYSGTEPIARVMVEGPDEEWIRAKALALAELVEGAIGPEKKP